MGRSPSVPTQVRSRPDSTVLLELDSTLLRSLIAVVDTGSFVGGARIVHRTPSAVSMQMKRLETQIGEPIFAHQGRSVVLTSAGEALLTYARRVLGIADEAMMRFNCLSHRSTVRLGMTDEYAIAFLPSVLASFAATHPLVEVSVTCRLSSVLSQMLNNGELTSLLLLLTQRVEQHRRAGESIVTGLHGRPSRTELPTYDVRCRSP